MLSSQRRAALALVLASMVGCHQRAAVRPGPAAADSVSDGYSERSKGQAGGGVQSVTFDDASSSNKVSRVEELIEARFAGVQVQRTSGGGYSVRIRGVGSFMSSEEVLFVVDGVPVEDRTGRGLSWLNPSDVARIDVLKNPSETSVYGVRGANGVIIITTKRPR